MRTRRHIGRKTFLIPRRLRARVEVVAMSEDLAQPAAGLGQQRLIGSRWSGEAFAVRELLERNLVPFTWHDLTTDDESRALLDMCFELLQRERKLVALVARGLRNREIAAELGITEGTVKVYLHTIYQKLSIKNRTELALIAHKAETLAHLTAFTIHPSIHFQDRAALEEALSGTRQDKDVSYVIVNDTAGNTLASFHPERASDRDQYKVTTPIVDEGKEIARLHIGVSLARLHREIVETRVHLQWRAARRNDGGLDRRPDRPGGIRRRWCRDVALAGQLPAVLDRRRAGRRPRGRRPRPRLTAAAPVRPA